MGAGWVVGVVPHAGVFISHPPHHGMNTGILQFADLRENHDKMGQG